MVEWIGGKEELEHPTDSLGTFLIDVCKSVMNLIALSLEIKWSWWHPTIKLFPV